MLMPDQQAGSWQVRKPHLTAFRVVQLPQRSYRSTTLAVTPRAVHSAARTFRRSAPATASPLLHRGNGGESSPGGEPSPGLETREAVQPLQFVHCGPCPGNGFSRALAR